MLIPNELNCVAVDGAVECSVRFRPYGNPEVVFPDGSRKATTMFELAGFNPRIWAWCNKRQAEVNSATSHPLDVSSI